ncbi:MAG: hypothetical protein GC190_02360 [Alphaproteobacteria bacterium]|nr:hypothetical protein [Alphaproteobacteria bacterium]
MPSLVRSVFALVAGIVTVVVLSEGTDALLRGIGVFPPLSEPTAYTNEMFASATVYRTLAGVVGGYATATLAPAKPMFHAIFLGVIGLVLSVAGVVANTVNHMGPDWYPIALAVTAFPSVWLGGRLRVSTRRPVQT